jgi:hypothetical protein
MELQRILSEIGRVLPAELSVQKDGSLRFDFGRLREALRQASKAAGYAFRGQVDGKSSLTTTRVTSSSKPDPPLNCLS